jgi:hypothetical protein
MSGESAKEVILYDILFCLIVAMFERPTCVLELENFVTAAMESSSPPKEPNCVLLLPHPHYKFSLEGILLPISTFICPLVGCLCYGL